MAGYTRQSSAQILSGEIVSAAPLNAEFNQNFAAFNNATGHKHDGTAAEGPPIDRIADADQLNKVLVDTSNNQLEFYVQVLSGSVEQIKIQDGAIVPVTDSDIDLGTSTLEFKDLYIDGTANIDALVADTADINAGTIDNTAIGGATPSSGAFTTISATGVVSLSDGSAGAPALTNTGDANNGLYFNAADELTYTSAGVAQVTFKDGAIVPVTDSDIDLGTSSLEFKDAYFDGTVTTDALVADTADINGGTADGVVIGGATPAAGSFTTLSATGVVSVSDGSAGAPAITNTGDANNGLYFNAADELTYTSAGVAQITLKDGAIVPVTDNDIDLGTSSLEFKNLYIDGTAYMDSVDIAGGSITGVTTLADLGNAVPLTFSTTTTDSDPGSGTVRLDNATQNAATTFYVDDADSNAAAIATFVQSLSAGNNPSATLGFVTLRKQFAPEVFATYKVTAVVNAAGYTKLTVANLAASATNPFSDADGVLLSIDLAGDKGDTGDIVTGVVQVASGGTGVTSSTGTGSVVLSTSPTLVTPALGTPASGVATNLTGTAASLTAGLATDIVTKTGTGSTYVTNTSPTLVTPALGTPASGVLTNTTGLPLTTGVTGVLPFANGGSGAITPLRKGVGYTAINRDYIIATAGSITITLPASPSAGDTVIIKDGTGAAATTTFTVARNGSNIASSATDLTFDKNWAEIVMTYIDGTIGWSV